MTILYHSTTAAGKVFPEQMIKIPDDAHIDEIAGKAEDFLDPHNVDLALELLRRESA